MDSKMEQQETISALADGQLRGEAFAAAAQWVASDPQARQAWHTYHLIGDVLRTGQPAPATAPEAFLARFAQRLANEQPYAIDAVVPAAHPVRVAGGGAPAANDGSFRWKLVAGFASLAAVAAIGWSALGSFGPAPAGQPQLAAVPAAQAQLASASAAAPAEPQAAPVLAASERGVMLRDARLDELLAAHRQFGGASALQMPAGFLRNATFESPGRQ